MAQYNIKFSCDHIETRHLYGKGTERERFIAWAGRQGRCSACNASDKDAHLGEIEAAHNLPALGGSDKQIAWARKIRAEKINDALKVFATYRARCMPDKIEAFDDMAATKLAALGKKDQSRYWIDNRDAAAIEMLAK